MTINDMMERINMYWVEDPYNTSVTELTNSQILENLAYAERRYEYLYCRELRRLEKIQSRAIIKNLEEFKSAQSKYFQIKSTHPKIWFENWEVYKQMVEEATRRNIALSDVQYETSEKMLCFG